MSYFNKGKSGGGRGDKKFGGKSFGKRPFEKRSFGGGQDGGRPAMHKAVCDECGNPCEVPFKPTGEKPVFCFDCFKKSEGGGGRDSGKRRFSDRDSDRPSMHKAVCDTCGRNFEVPFRPSGEKPLYCRDCFGKDKPKRMDTPYQDTTKKSTTPDQYKVQFEILNTKLDKILKALTSVVALAAPKVEAPQEEMTEKKPKAKKSVKE